MHHTKDVNVPDTVKIAVRIWGTIVVNYDIHTLNIDTASEYISSNKDTLLECFKGSVSVDTINGFVSISLNCA